MIIQTGCRVCGHINQIDYKYCSDCGLPRYARRQGASFKQEYRIHPQANLKPMLQAIGKGYLSLTLYPTVHQLEDFCCHNLTKSQAQHLIRRHNLHLPGTNKPCLYSKMDIEKGASSASQTKSAEDKLYYYLSGPDWRIVKTGK